MTGDDAALMTLAQAIAAGETARAVAQLTQSPELARAALAQGATRRAAKSYFITAIRYSFYAGSTALHAAAAGYQAGIARELIARGADVRARNRRGAEPLHAAAIGAPRASWWNPRAQAETIALLIAAGADPNARDMDGVTPLHRAVRTRSAAAVEALLTAGAKINAKNKSGSTPLRLAGLTTGRSGSGSLEAKAEQAKIIAVLKQHGARL
ncbi:MAG: ankyrin repeat domain-containing protein [Alphaproteobacteria bacterium]|nr:ankyrin repeat domain-containing protein [Alphaproteobacteria bacterium]